MGKWCEECQHFIANRPEETMSDGACLRYPPAHKHGDIWENPKVWNHRPTCGEFKERKEENG